MQHVMTTAYHPQSNGMVERFHRRLKNALRARGAASTWASELPLVLLGLRSAPMDDVAVSSAEMTYGSALSLPSSFLDAREPPDAAFTARLQAATAGFSPPATNAAAGDSYVSPRLQTAAYAFVRRDGHVPPLQPLYAGPYTILGRSEKFYTLQIGERKVNVSVDRLKPVIAPAEVQVAQPPRRGRPRKQRSAPPPPSAAASPPRRRPRPSPPRRAPTRRLPPRRCTRRGGVSPSTSTPVDAST